MPALTPYELATGRSPMPITPVDTTAPVATSTNDKIAAAIAAAGDPPAGYHWNQVLGADGKPTMSLNLNSTQNQQNGTTVLDSVKKGTQTTGGVVDTGVKKFTSTDGQVFDSEAAMLYHQNQLDTTAGTNQANQNARQSAYDLLQQEFTKYGLGDLVAGIKGLITDATVNPSEISLRLKQTPAYQMRFSANADRVKAGLTELTPAEYVGLEDQYQKVMQNYGLPASYYTVGQYGKQSGFDKLLAGDVSSKELEDRIATAQTRVVNANPDVLKALKSFYPDITNGDILAYTLDPKNALEMIHRKVTAAEIGGAALNAGLDTNANRAELLASYGITGQQYSQNAQTIASSAQRGSQLAGIYGQQPYGQTQAEQEALNLAGGTEAAAARKKLTSLETANFSGQSGTASNAFSRERAMSPMMLGVPGAGSY